MQHNHNKSVRIPRNHTSGSCEVHRHIAEKALQKTMPRNEIKHAARVLSRYRDARRTRILRIRLRLTVRVKKPVKSPGYPEIFHRFFQLFFVSQSRFRLAITAPESQLRVQPSGTGQVRIISFNTLLLLSGRSRIRSVWRFSAFSSSFSTSGFTSKVYSFVRGALMT